MVTRHKACPLRLESPNALAHEISAGTFGVDAEVMELADVERAWAQAGRTSRRIVLVP